MWTSVDARYFAPAASRRTANCCNVLCGMSLTLWTCQFARRSFEWRAALSSTVRGGNRLLQSQVAMTLAAVCAMDYPDNGVIFFDVEHNFSAKRLLQITIARIKLTQAGQEADINELAAAVIKRIRVVKVNSIAAFASKYENITLCWISGRRFNARPASESNATDGKRLEFIMERHSLHHAITIVKSSVAGYVVQPFTVKEGGVEAIESSRQADFHEFAIHDDLLSDLAMATLPMVVPACTLRSTQQSNAEDPDATQLISQSDDLASQSQQDQAQETESSSFDIVSDSNSEEEHESFHWGAVTEE
ncbi:P-loop containing nucleoside triphosphate hydrolase [Phytophthora cactorum]|nr:P-loop containing nucleoside triphosphate hydrolase [Phytophthora cactorum]